MNPNEPKKKKEKRLHRLGYLRKGNTNEKIANKDEKSQPKEKNNPTNGSIPFYQQAIYLLKLPTARLYSTH